MPELPCIKHRVAIVKVHYTTMHTKAQIQTFSDWGTSFTLSYKSKYFRRENNFLRNLFELTLTLIQKRDFSGKFIHKWKLDGTDKIFVLLNLIIIKA